MRNPKGGRTLAPRDATEKCRANGTVRQDGGTATRYMVTNELGTERDNKKAAGIKGGWHVKTYPLRRFGLSPRLLICLHGGVADLPSECPFGAERGTERTALSLPLCEATSKALR
ncbi:MAG: hypothetical protein WB564_06120 [Dehalococcoidia bacterium]